MDRQPHLYEVDLEELLDELTRRLATRGYAFGRRAGCSVLTVHTRWDRGAAVGEIGSTLCYLLAERLHERAE